MNRNVSAVNCFLQMKDFSRSGALQSVTYTVNVVVSKWCKIGALSSKPAAAAVDRRDRQTDGRTLDRFIDSAAHTVRRRHYTVSQQKNAHLFIFWNISVRDQPVFITFGAPVW